MELLLGVCVPAQAACILRRKYSNRPEVHTQFILSRAALHAMQNWGASVAPASLGKPLIPQTTGDVTAAVAAAAAAGRQVRAIGKGHTWTPMFFDGDGVTLTPFFIPTLPSMWQGLVLNPCLHLCSKGLILSLSVSCEGRACATLVYGWRGATQRQEWPSVSTQLARREPRCRQAARCWALQMNCSSFC